MSYVPRHAGTVTDDGRLVLADPSAWRGTLARHRGRSVWVTVTRQQVSRSPQANRYYWAVIVEEIASYIGESREETHQLLKAQFLPGRDIELLDGKRLQMPASTTRLSVEQFAAYIESIKTWAAQFLGLAIPEPGEVEVVI